MEIDQYPNIRNHLEKFREILESRGGHTRGEQGWWALHRPRAEKFLRAQKIVCPRWGERGPGYFGFQRGEYFEGTDTRVIVPNDSAREDILYILAILNSYLIKKWIIEKVQRRGYTAQSALSQIPICRIDFNNSVEVRMHDEIVNKVKLIREKMRELAFYSKYFEGPRLTRLKPQDPLPDINSEPIVQALLPEKRFSLRTYPDIKINYGRDFEEARFILNKVGKVDLTLYGPELKLTGKDRKVIIVGGSEELLQIISLILENYKNESWSSIKELPLIPETVKDYDNKKQEVIEKVVTLRTEIQKLQASIDAIVFDLCGVSESFGEIANK